MQFIFVLTSEFHFEFVLKFSWVSSWSFYSIGIFFRISLEMSLGSSSRESIKEVSMGLEFFFLNSFRIYSENPLISSSVNCFTKIVTLGIPFNFPLRILPSFFKEFLQELCRKFLQKYLNNSSKNYSVDTPPRFPQGFFTGSPPYNFPKRVPLRNSKGNSKLNSEKQNPIEIPK